MDEILKSLGAFGVIATPIVGAIAYFLFRKFQDNKETKKITGITDEYRKHIQALEEKKKNVDVGIETINKEIARLETEMVDAIGASDEKSLNEIVDSLNNRYPKQ